MQDGRSLDVAGRIIAAVTEKLNANRSELAKSKFGKVIWRTDKNGKVDVDLEPRI